MLTLHLPREFQTHVVHGHAVLPLFIDRKTRLTHLARIIRIELEMKEAGALTILEKAVALDGAGVALDREPNVLTLRLRKVHAGECAHGPLGFVARISSMMMLP